MSKKAPDLSQRKSDMSTAVLKSQYIVRGYPAYLPELDQAKLAGLCRNLVGEIWGLAANSTALPLPLS